MFALIAAREYGGSAELLATARTLPAMQRKWRKILDGVDHPYSCVGILTPDGMVNFYGSEIEANILGWISIKMDVSHENDPGAA